MKSKEKIWKGQAFRFLVQKASGRLWIHYKGETWHWRPRKEKPRGGAAASSLDRSSKSKPQKGLLSALAPVPGSVLKIFAKKGEFVEKGGPLAVISSMKTEFTVNAAAQGRIVKVFVQEGSIVSKGDILIETSAQ